MPHKFKNKYRIESARAGWWDYADAASYFVTVCTKDNQMFFGNIENGKMNLNELGKIVYDEWLRTIDLRPDMNLKIGEFIVMPNHFHAIIIIGENEYNRKSSACHCARTCPSIPPLASPHDRPLARPHTRPHTRTDAMHRVCTCMRARANAEFKPTQKNQFGPQSKNLASIMRGFKSAVTTRAKKMGMMHFAWHPRFYDHIIRNSFSYARISTYIRQNPKKWNEDKFFR